MENKYFTPKIEDIRIGYECEIKNYPYLFDRGFCFECKETENIWYKGELDFSAMNFLFSNRNWNQTWIRVPYLTKEQIEAEGWTLQRYQKGKFKGELRDFRDGEGNSVLVFNNENYSGLYVAEKHYMEINMINTEPMRYIYQGECKDINTFRYICKLLNIK